MAKKKTTSTRARTTKSAPSSSAGNRAKGREPRPLPAAKPAPRPVKRAPAGRHVAAIIRAALSKQAEEPVLLDLRGLTPFADFFFICHGNSVRQNQAICEGIREALEKEGYRVDHVEGFESADWILMDCDDVVVHIFTPARREFYGLERLWGDAAPLPLQF